MNFLSGVFYIFIIIFLSVYYLVPVNKRYVVIFLGSFLFYGYSNPKILLILIAAALISYIGGLVIQKLNYSKKAFVIAFAAEVLLLVVYKYTGFIFDTFNSIAGRLGMDFRIGTDLKLVTPIGLSFIVFQTCTYLSDVYRRHFEAEKNLIKFFAFASFFPTVLSGPIQKAHNLLPQISQPKPFDYEEAQKGILLFVWGLFEKLLVANNLMQVSSLVLSDYQNRSSAEILIGAIAFSFYIYADFSSYSDIARGISEIMGIDVGKNFNNPYLSKSTSEFWNRWHMSLNDWLIDNVYIPLGGNRKGKTRKYINMMIVFAISGLWHGASWHFVAWGVINAGFAITGQILKPYKKRLAASLNIDETVESIVFLKRLVVFFLITLTWVFFNKGIMDSLRIWKRIILFDFVSIFDPEILNIGGTATATFIALAATIFFGVIQICRQRESEQFAKYKRQPFFIKCCIVALMVCTCIFAAFNTEAAVNTQFLYFQF